MRLIITQNEISNMFDDDKPSIVDVLNNESIKQLTKGFKVTSVYKDKVNTNNINNYVIELEVANGN